MFLSELEGGDFFVYEEELFIKLSCPVRKRMSLPTPYGIVLGPVQSWYAIRIKDGDLSFPHEGYEIRLIPKDELFKHIV